MSEIQPLVLLADSQLLFWSDAGGRRFLARLAAMTGVAQPRAAYLGASNGDQPEFFELFAGAWRDVAASPCRHVPAEPSAEELAFLSQAELLLLAGGDPVVGQRAFQEHGVARLLAERRAAGALLVGVSAGAVQFGLAWRDAADPAAPSQPMLALVPFAIGAHDEPDWTSLRALVEEGGPAWRGVGVPSGGGVLVHGDLSLEPLRRPLALLEWRGDQLETLHVAPLD